MGQRESSGITVSRRFTCPEEMGVVATPREPPSSRSRTVCFLDLSCRSCRGSLRVCPSDVHVTCVDEAPKHEAAQWGMEPSGQRRACSEGFQPRVTWSSCPKGAGETWQGRGPGAPACPAGEEEGCLGRVPAAPGTRLPSSRQARVARRPCQELVVGLPSPGPACSPTIGSLGTGPWHSDVVLPGAVSPLTTASPAS